MNFQTNLNTVLTKSHKKSVIRAILIGSKEFVNIFSNDPFGDINDSACHIVVLQTMVCSNYVIVEYMREDDYKSYMQDGGIIND